MNIDKKTIIQGKVANIFPDIKWLYDKKNELKKENFDACDAYVACLGVLNRERYGEIKITVSNVEYKNKHIKFIKKYWDRKEDIKITL